MREDQKPSRGSYICTPMVDEGVNDEETTLDVVGSRI